MRIALCAWRESDTGQAEASDVGMSVAPGPASVQMCRFQQFPLPYSTSCVLAKNRVICQDRSEIALSWHKLDSTEI